jgi:nitrogen fixation/metabolism regulation signal transduction histidine kinase
MEPWLEHFARANFERSADTAHDLKTPLNVAVLNLELLRMRLRKLAEVADDEKINGYLQSIEVELRRMGRIFDAFFLLSTPPRTEGEPGLADLSGIVRECASAAGLSVKASEAIHIKGHESRIRQAVKLFMDGAVKIVRRSDLEPALAREGNTAVVSLSGNLVLEELDLTKVFKLYYSDPEGNPDLSLAVARLIAETYGGQLNALGERDKVVLRLSFPLGAR